MHVTIAALTEREREVLEQVALGLRSKEIARRLTISGETVNAHVKSIYRKLQVHSRAQLVRMASQAGVF
jgi:DNA-binding CsgD family transcriptional regulator